MKLVSHLFVCALAVCAGIGAVFAQWNSSTSGDVEQILASERAWAQAPAKGNVADMARLMSDDYVEIVMETTQGTNNSSWVTTSKSEWVDLVRSGREQYGSVDLRNLKVDPHGDVATIPGDYSHAGSNDGRTSVEED